MKACSESCCYRGEAEAIYKEIQIEVGIDKAGFYALKVIDDLLLYLLVLIIHTLTLKYAPAFILVVLQPWTGSI